MLLSYDWLFVLLLFVAICLIKNGNLSCRAKSCKKESVGIQELHILYDITLQKLSFFNSLDGTDKWN